MSLTSNFYGNLIQLNSQAIQMLLTSDRFTCSEVLLQRHMLLGPYVSRVVAAGVLGRFRSGLWYLEKNWKRRKHQQLVEGKTHVPIEHIIHFAVPSTPT
jgi:hypothetical protein